MKGWRRVPASPEAASLDAPDVNTVAECEKLRERVLELEAHRKECERQFQEQVARVGELEERLQMGFHPGMQLNINDEAIGRITAVEGDRIYIESDAFSGWAAKAEIEEAINSLDDQDWRISENHVISRAFRRIFRKHADVMQILMQDLVAEVSKSMTSEEIASLKSQVDFYFGECEGWRKAHGKNVERIRATEADLAAAQARVGELELQLKGWHKLRDAMKEQRLFLRTPRTDKEQGALETYHAIYKLMPDASAPASQPEEA